MMLSAQEPIHVASAVGFSAVLLWLGAELAAEAGSRSRSVFWGLTGASVVLIACGVWWPAHVMPAPGTWSASNGWEALLAWLLALAWATCILAAAAFATPNTLPAFGGFAMAGVLAAYVHAMMVTPQLLRLTSDDMHAVPGLVLLTSALALGALHGRQARAAVVRVVRASAAPVAAPGLSCGAAAPVG